jgi:hypothetical protein
MSMPSDVTEHAIAVAATSQGLFALLSIYGAGGGVNAAGQLRWADPEPEGPVQSVLSSGDKLACLWASPAGFLWVGSANGNIYTTAPVPAPSVPDPRFETTQDHPDYRWTIMRLPPRLGLQPNVTALWGSDDTDVFAACFDGTVFHWNGTAWRDTATGVSTPLGVLYGSGPADVYCAGMFSRVLHYDGTVWRVVPLPPEAGEHSVVTGLRIDQNGEAVAVTRRGLVLAGGPDGLKLRHAGKVPWLGIERYQQRWFLATSPDGAWELTGRGPRQIADWFATTNVMRAGELIFFIEDEYPEDATVIEFDPRRPGGAWARRGF